MWEFERRRNAPPRCDLVLTLDPTSPISSDDPNVYSTLIAWQSSLLWQILPVTLLSLYWDTNAWACLIGQFCGLCTIVGLCTYTSSTNGWTVSHSSPIP
jgi:Na+/proline symporter